MLAKAFVCITSRMSWMLSYIYNTWHICAWLENVLRVKKWRETFLGSSSASCLVCMGAVEVEVDRPVLTVAAAVPPVLQRIASFKMS